MFLFLLCTVAAAVDGCNDESEADSDDVALAVVGCDGVVVVAVAVVLLLLSSLLLLLLLLLLLVSIN